MKESNNKHFKLNIQTLFCLISFIFIVGCILYYGTTFIKLHKENQESLIEKSKIFAEELKEINYESNNLKKINKTYYYNGNVTNNYITYSNILFRILKINEDNSMVLVTDSPIGTLAYGNINEEYSQSNIINWLNNNVSNILNTKEKYLKFTSTCIDNITNIDSITCNNIVNDKYLSLLTIEDYLNSGGNTSFINNNKYTYLANKNEEEKIWYINQEGAITLTDGLDILGIKATITVLPTIKKVSGDGTIDNPYYFEEANNLIGSYVSLGQDTWRIYEEKEGILKLVLQDTIKDFKYHYSNNTYNYNDTIKNTLAYYLNNTYYNSLNYKSIIVKNNYSNGSYGNELGYKHNDIKTNTINTNIAIPSIDDIIFNNASSDYFTNTGKDTNKEALYIIKGNDNASARLVTTESNVIPCISIKQEILKLGTGTKNDPYRMEN